MPTFTEKHAEWTMAMRGDDSRPRNSIHSQIVELVDSAAWYRVVLLARDLAPKGESATEHLNGPFHRWIDTTFSDSFFIRVRRLAGGTSDSLDGKRGCYSLLALIRDLRANRSLLTRGNLLALDDLPFDLAAADRLLEDTSRKATGWVAIPSRADVRRSKRRNAEIDQLCGVDEAGRSLTDTVLEEVFTDIEARLASATSDLNLITDKLVAHASTLESRQRHQKDIETISITMNDLWSAMECLCRSVAALDGWLITRMSHAFLPDMRTHHWNGIDFPLVQTHNAPQLKDYWKQLEKEATQWGSPPEAQIRPQ